MQMAMGFILEECHVFGDEFVSSIVFKHPHILCFAIIKPAKSAIQDSYISHILLAFKHA